MTSAIDLHGAPHVARYLETDGEDGFHWRNGTTILILFTRGRKSGAERSHALIFREFEGNHPTAPPATPNRTKGKYLVVASKGGAPEPPAWFVNLSAEPHVEVQIKGDRFPATARVATPAEKPAMWATMIDAWPDYDEYTKRTDREIPVVVLERA